MSLLLVGGVVAGRRRDVRVSGERIEEVGPALLPRGEEILEVEGCSVLPGLHDHHVHLRALAALAGSVKVGPPEVRDRAGLAAALAEAAATAPGTGDAGPDRWIRAIGYHESVAGPLDRRILDELGPAVPLRVQHRSGARWTVNSRGAELLALEGLDLPGVERDAAGHPTGNLFRLDEWLRQALVAVPADIGQLSARLASLGVTGLTDTTPGRSSADVAAFVEDVTAGRLRQRLWLMCPPDVEVPEAPRLGRGPHKVMLDDPTLPSPEELAREVARAHGAGLAVAVHCVTLVQLVVTIEALGLAGPRAGDRIEHAGVVLPEQFEALRALGVTVVTNPSFVFERGDAYLAEVERRDLPHLYRCASLIRAGIPVAGGTDAPFADANPWLAVAAAVRRRTREGAALGPHETLDGSSARALFLGQGYRPARARRIEPGAPADICVVGPGAPEEVGDPSADPTPEVVATVVAGRLVHRRSV